MVLTDSHTHLYDKESVISVIDLIKKAENNHVFRFFIPNIDINTCTEVLNLQKQFPNQCFAMLGLHPCHVKYDFEVQIAFMKDLLDNNPVKAIGEIGMDLYWDRTFLEEQKKAFILQCEWAAALKLPISIHCREAFPEVMGILKTLKHLSLKGIFHCFTGTESEAKQIIEAGFYLGIGGVLTYKNSSLKETIKSIDLKHIVLETDAPYLPPVPFRGKPNESSYLIYIAEFLAKLKGISLLELADITTQNTKLIFGV